MAFGDHNFLHLTAIILACITFNITILFTSGAFGHRLGLFYNNSLAEKYMLDKYQLDVTPAEWTFYMAALIYLWQSIWLTYSVTLVCRKAAGGYFYVVFPVLPPDLFVVFSFSLACNIGWMLIWDKEYMEVALVFINLMTCTIYICLVVCLRRLNDYGQAMIAHDLGRHIWYIRLFVQNGLAMFATWGIVASIFNFAVVLSYGTGTTQEVASTVSLIIYTLEIISWWVFDNFVFERHLRYLFTPYIVVLVSIAGIISRQMSNPGPNSLYTIVMFTMACILTIIKIFLTAWRHKKRPIFNTKARYRQPIVNFEGRTLLES